MTWKGRGSFLSFANINCSRIHLSNSLKSCISWRLRVSSFEFGVGTNLSHLDNRLVSSFESISLDMFWMYLSFCCLRLLFLLSFWISLVTFRDFDFDLGCSCVSRVFWFVSAFRFKIKFEQNLKFQKSKMAAACV